VNIAGAMAAIKLEGLDRASKHALLVIACRADRHTGALTRSLPALAADMGASEITVWRAVARLKRRGYLQVVHRAGDMSTYKLGTPVNMTRGTPVNVKGVPLSNRSDTLVNMTTNRRSTREKQEGGARPRTLRAAGASVDKDGGGSSWTPNPRPHPPGCVCGGVGWVDNPDNPSEVQPCEH
jgi:hypothetical protein